ncbi:MAG: hypothetical protein IIC56_06125, partial [Proteobacteria bacterium]|nr:hypothetical protein [Pseudomonadota bacterium]
TQTIRLWRFRRMKPGQRSYIPGAGYIRVASVDPVELESLTDADAVIICVPTPLGKTKDPDLSCVVAATEDIASRLHLHARAIRIPHPAGGILKVSAPLPDHMRVTFDMLGFDAAAEKELFFEPF